MLNDSGVTWWTIQVTASWRHADVAGMGGGAFTLVYVDGGRHHA